MVLGMGVTELAVILLVVLVVFGPKNLPKLGSALGKTVKNVREGMEGADEPVAATSPVADSPDASLSAADEDASR